MTNQTPPHHDPASGLDTQDTAELTGPAADVFTALTGKTDCTAADLARATGLGRSTATKALAYLERCGLAVRTRGQLQGGRRTPDRWEPAREQATQPDTTEHTETTVELDTNPTTAQDNTAHAPRTNTVQPADNPASAAEDGYHTTPNNHPNSSIEPDETQRHANDAPATRQTLGTPAADPEARPAPTPSAGRLAPGALREQVLTHLQAHPTEAFTATQISRAIDRSSGAIANALATLTTKGLAKQVTDAPRRYRLTDTGADTR